MNFQTHFETPYVLSFFNGIVTTGVGFYTWEEAQDFRDDMYCKGVDITDIECYPEFEKVELEEADW